MRTLVGAERDIFQALQDDLQKGQEKLEDKRQLVKSIADEKRKKLEEEKSLEKKIELGLLLLGNAMLPPLLMHRTSCHPMCLASFQRSCRTTIWTTKPGWKA